VEAWQQGASIGRSQRLLKRGFGLCEQGARRFRCEPDALLSHTDRNDLESRRVGSADDVLGRNNRDFMLDAAPPEDQPETEPSTRHRRTPGSGNMEYGTRN